MNICTYVQAVSRKPKMYSVALDYKGQSYQNLIKNGRAILQLLSHQNLDCIKMLGKKSGATYDKQEWLIKKNLLQDWKGNLILKELSAVMKLDLSGHKNIGGDHELFYFKLKYAKTFSEDRVLMFQDLINEGLIL